MTCLQRTRHQITLRLDALAQAMQAEPGRVWSWGELALALQRAGFSINGQQLSQHMRRDGRFEMTGSRCTARWALKG